MLVERVPGLERGDYFPLRPLAFAQAGGGVSRGLGGGRREQGAQFFIKVGPLFGTERAVVEPADGELGDEVVVFLAGGFHGRGGLCSLCDGVRRVLNKGRWCWLVLGLVCI